MVEHSLGKGEVVGSIPTGSTSKKGLEERGKYRDLPLKRRHRRAARKSLERRERSANPHRDVGRMWGKCSLRVPKSGEDGAGNFRARAGGFAPPLGGRQRQHYGRLPSRCVARATGFVVVKGQAMVILDAHG